MGEEAVLDYARLVLKGHGVNVADAVEFEAPKPDWAPDAQLAELLRTHGVRGF